MASIARNKFVNILNSWGWSFDQFDAAWSASYMGLSFNILGLRSSQTYRGLTCQSANISTGLRGANLRIRGLHLLLLLSHGELFMMSPAQDGTSNVKKTSVTFFGTLMARVIEWITFYYLGRLSVEIEDFSLRIESSQNGRSFAATISFDSFIITGAPGSRGQTAVNCQLQGFQIVWDSDPSAFAYLRQKTPSKTDNAVKILSDVDVSVNNKLHNNFSLVDCSVSFPNAVSMFVNKAILLDMLSVAQGGGLPNAWGLDRSPKALWERAMLTIKARRKFELDKKVRSLISRLRAEKITSNSFDEFYSRAEILVTGGQLEAALTPAQNIARNVAEERERKIKLAVNACEGFRMICDTEPDRTSIHVNLSSPLEVSASSSDGTARVQMKDLRIGLPANGWFEIGEIDMIASSTKGIEKGWMRYVSLREQEMDLYMLDRLDVQSQEAGRLLIKIGNNLIWDEWPRMWNLFLAGKLLGNFFTSALEDLPITKVELPGESNKSRSDDKLKQSLTASIQVDSFLLLESETPSKHIHKGFGFQWISVDADLGSNSVRISIAEAGPYTSSRQPEKIPAIQLEASQEPESIPKVSITCVNAMFSLNTSLALFWLKIKGPPPALPPITEPILSLLPLQAPEHIIKISIDKCKFAIGDETLIESTYELSSIRTRSFFDPTGELASQRSGSSDDEFFDTKATVFEATHYVKLNSKSFSLIVEDQPLFHYPQITLSVAEGLEIGGTRIELFGCSERPSLNLYSAKPVQSLLKLQTKLTPYQIPQPIVPLEFRYFPDIRIHLAGVEIFFGPQPAAQLVWNGLDFILDAAGGGNYVLLRSLDVQVKGFMWQWNLQSPDFEKDGNHVQSQHSSKWTPLVMFPHGGPGKNVMTGHVDFKGYEEQQIKVDLFAGLCSVPFACVQQILDLRQEIKKFGEDLSTKPAGDEIEEDLSTHELRVVHFMEDLNIDKETSLETTRYSHEQTAAVVSKQTVKLMNAHIELQNKIDIILLDTIEFSIGQLTIDIVNDGKARTQETQTHTEFRLNIAHLPVLHPTNLKAILVENTEEENRYDRNLQVHFFDAVRMELQRASIGPVNALLKLLESKTTEKDNLKVTSAVTVKEEAIPTLTARTRMTTRIDTSIPSFSVAIHRRCARTKRDQRVIFVLVDGIHVEGLKKRSQSRLEIAYSLSINCMDDIQILDPTRLVTVARANGQEEVFASVSQPELDVDVHTVDPLNFNITSQLFGALQIVQDITEKSKLDAQHMMIAEKNSSTSGSIVSQPKPNVITEGDEEEVIYSANEEGFYLFNDSGKQLHGTLIAIADVSLHATQTAEDVFVYGGWLKMCDATGLVWHRRYVQVNPLSITFFEHQDGAPLDSLSLLDPLENRFLDVSFAGDSDEEWRSIEGISSIAAMSSSLVFPKEFKENRSSRAEAKSVRSFQLSPHSLRHQTSVHHRKFRFITKDVKTKLELVRFLHRARSAWERVSTSHFNQLAISSESVIVEGAGACFITETSAKAKKTSGVGKNEPGKILAAEKITCFAELDGTCLSFYSKKVPRRSMMAESFSSTDTSFIPATTLSNTTSAASMIANEYQRGTCFLGCLDLFFALAVFRENTADTPSFFVEFSHKPVRVRFTFSSLELARHWERSIAETIAVCFEIKSQFERVSERKSFVFGPGSRTSDFILQAGEIFHVEDSSRAALLGPLLVDSTLSNKRGQLKRKSSSSSSDGHSSDAEEEDERCKARERFLPQLFVGLKDRLVRYDQSTIRVASQDREHDPDNDIKLLNSQKVFKIQSRAVLFNATAEFLDIRLMQLQFRTALRSDEIVSYYSLRNVDSSPRIFSWGLIEEGDMQKVLDERIDQGFAEGEVRWFKLPMDGMKMNVEHVRLMPVQNNTQSDPLTAILGAWLVPSVDNLNQIPETSLSVGARKEVSLPAEEWCGVSDSDCVPALIISAKKESNSQKEEVLLPLLRDTHRLDGEGNAPPIRMQTYFASSRPRRVVTVTHFTRENRFTLVVEDLLLIENALPHSLWIRRFGLGLKQTSNKMVRIDSCGGQVVPEFVEFLYSDDMESSLTGKAFERTRDELEFGLNLAEAGNKIIPAKMDEFIMEEEMPYRGHRRLQFVNGDSALVKIYGGYRGSNVFVENLTRNESEEWIEPGESEEKRQRDQDRQEEDEWLEHFNLRQKSVLPLTISIEARIRVCNQSRLDLFLRSKTSYSIPMLLRHGDTGFVAEDDTVLEVAMVSPDGVPVAWSKDSFVCRPGVNGVVEAKGVLATQSFKFAVDVSGVDNGTLVNISPFFTLVNGLNFAIELHQVRTNSAMLIPIGETVPFHPLDIDGNGILEEEELFVMVRIKNNNRKVSTQFSAPFRMDIIQEQLLVCDEEVLPSLDEDLSSIDPTEQMVLQNWQPVMSTNSLVVSGDEMKSSHSNELEGEDALNNNFDFVFAVNISSNNGGIRLSFVPASNARQAVRYKFVNSTSSDTFGVCETKSTRDDLLPVIVQPGKTVPYVFRSQDHHVTVSVLRSRDQDPIEVDLSDVGWSHHLGNGLVFEVVETQIGRCLVLLDPELALR